MTAFDVQSICFVHEGVAPQSRGRGRWVPIVRGWSFTKSSGTRAYEELRDQSFTKSSGTTALRRAQGPELFSFVQMFLSLSSFKGDVPFLQLLLSVYTTEEVVRLFSRRTLPQESFLGLIFSFTWCVLPVSFSFAKRPALR